MSDSLRDALRAYNVTVQEASEGMARAARLIAAAVRGEREDEPMTDQPDLVAWLRAQLDEDERVARAVRDASWRETLNLDKPGWNEFDQTEIDHIVRHDPARVLAEVAAKRAILDWHESWPVLVETEPEFTTTTGDPNTMAFQMSKRIAWLTEQEYRARFGDEPPTSPIVRALAQPYAGRPGWRKEWAT